MSDIKFIKVINFIILIALVSLIIAILAGCDSTGHRSATATSSPAVSMTPALAPVAKHTVTFVATGDVASITYGVNGADQSGMVPMRITRPLSPDRMAMYSIIALLPSQYDTTTISIEVDGKVVGRVTASAIHQIATVTIWRHHPHGRWFATPSYQ
jgi:hypothetical protein